MRRPWLTFLAIIFIIGLPILLNFIVFTPTNKFSVGRLQDWVSFWGSYLGAIISALAAFTILYVQRRDNKVENSKNRQLQINVLSYQQEIKWLSELRKALINYISAYRENDIKDIINSIPNSSFDSVQQKIKLLYTTLSRTDTALALVIFENPKTRIGDTYKNELDDYYKRYTSIIKDIELLACLYYNKIPAASNDSERLNNLIITMGINPQSFNYDQFSELSNQLIEPLPNIFESIRGISMRCIIEEKQRIETFLKDSI